MGHEAFPVGSFAAIQAIKGQNPSVIHSPTMQNGDLQNILTAVGGLRGVVG